MNADPHGSPAPAAAAASRLVATLEGAWATIRARHADVPDVVMVVASGNDHRGVLRTWGHFAAGRWQAAGHDRAEVLIGAEGLARPPVEVLGTLLHEAAHGLAHTRSIADTSRQGRYHNRRYRTLAQELGLDVADRPPLGWTATSVPTPTVVRYQPTLDELTEALVLWRHTERAKATAGRSSNLLACACACGRRIRVARSTLAAAPILCGACREPVSPALELTRKSLLPKAATEQTSSGLSPFLSRDGVGDENSRVGVEEGRVWIEAAKLREATEPLVRDLQATLAWDQARARSEVDWWLRLAVDGLGLRFGPSDPQLAADDEELVEAVVVRAAEAFQKWAHETFVDTSWPSCLRHGRHPMSLGSPTTAALRGAAPRTRR